MTVEELVLALEGMPHGERVRQMVALGRQGDEESRALLAALETGGFYRRYLALYACFGSRDRDVVVRALADPSRIIRGLATRLVPVVCEAAELVEVLEAAPAQTRRTLLWRLRKHRQQEAIDAFLERLAASDDPQLFALLPLGSAALVARFAGRFAERAAKVEWLRLARFHPTLALELLWRRVEAADPLPQDLADLALTLLPHVSRANPDRAVAVALALQRARRSVTRAVDALMRERPIAVADLVLAETGYFWLNFSPVAHRLRDDQILALLARQSHALNPYTTWLARLPVERRLTLLAAGGRQVRQQSTMYQALVAVLPKETRQAEARKQLAREELRLTERLSYASYLPWDEAKAALEMSLHATDVLERQTALSALVGAVAYQRERLPDALAVLVARRSEHDTVRGTMLQALERLPVGTWRAEDLPALAEILRHGLNDVGLSQSTQRAMMNLLFKLAPAHLAWCAEQIGTVMSERGWVAPTYPLANLPAPVAARLAEALRPVLYTWMARERDNDVLAVLEALAAAPAASAPLLPLAEEVVQRTQARTVAERALELIATYVPRRLDDLVPTLIGQDASWVTLAPVARYLFRRRQDLLTPFLRRQAYTGRWGTGRARYLPRLEARFTTGTARQQEQFADALMEIIGDRAQDSWALARAVQELALLPAVPAARLAALSTDQRTMVRTTALFALGRMDSDDGLATLTGALGDPRARIAIHALRPFLLTMPPERALGILRGVAMERVTVAKEVVRLMGEVRSEGAYAELVALAERPLHRDVRVAVLRVLGEKLERAETWPVLERAATDPEREIALAALPRDHEPLRRLAAREETGIRQRAYGVVGLLLRHADASVRRMALDVCRSLALPDRERVVIPRVLELVRQSAPSADAEVENAARALFSLSSEEDATSVAALIGEVLPDRRHLQILVEAARQVSKTQHAQALMEAVIAAMAVDPLTATLRVELAVAKLPGEALARCLTSLAEVGALHAEALMRACELIVANGYDAKPEQLREIEDTLAASADERLRRLALAALVAQTRRQSFWSRDQLERLHRFRADPAPLVAGAAQFTLPREERDEERDEA